MADPDERCGVCQETRENHGDKKHKFDVDGVLKPLDPPAPKPPGGVIPNPPMQMAMQLRLVEILIQKDILNGEDMLYIFGGGVVAHNRGEAGEGSASGNSGQSPT